ncbi:MAG TPA: L-threonylcarbamoyladenylate synthase [Methylophilaceae bacterium]|nr:L-threonylcarbamoyladenylate synthase [Methylophilaceae bacterium]
MLVNLAQAITLLTQGEVVAIPTETVYGLAADARNEQAIKKIYSTKERPASNPLIVHIASSEQVLDWAKEFVPLAKKFADAFWPGPLTLVLPARENVSKIVRAGEPTVALRVPVHPVARELLLQSKLGLAAPSANKYTQLSPTTAQHVSESLGENIAVLDGGACKVGIESTIVSVLDNQWQILRLGMISANELEAVAGMPALENQADLPKAPGQHRLHYSPKTPIKLFESREALLAFSKTEQDCAMLLTGRSDTSSHKTYILSADPSKAAEQLYDTLHQMDELNVNTLLVELPPNDEAWLAIRDRLQRASQKLN